MFSVAKAFVGNPHSVTFVISHSISSTATLSNEVCCMCRWIAIACLAITLHPFVRAQEPDQRETTDRRITVRVAPVYPELARKMNIEGIVRLRVTVAPDGAAKAAEVLGGNPVLAKAGQDAISRWKWAPAPRESTELVQLRFHPH